ncbi:MAG: NAD-dependent epimerase/dehydratase family protein [Candidatus Kariarchaeaceae archaeon]|jgi:nucleoside-diphosphate-sugar epimerase
MAQLLVIGGSRFIGKHVLMKLSGQGHDITVINRGNVPHEKYLPEGAVHFAVDRDDEEAMRTALEGKNFDIVYDICCITKHHAKIVIKVLSGNVRRFVQVSTGSVYDMEVGAILSLPIEEDHPYQEIKEDTHPYVRDKTQAEQVLLKAYKQNGFPVTFLRPTFVYGPDNYVYREAYFFDRISRDRPILVPEKGNGFYDLVYVDDLAEMIILAGNSDADKVHGEAFNTSSGNFLTGNMFTQLVAKNIGKEADIVYYPLSLAEELDWPEEKVLFPYVPEGGFALSAMKMERVLGFKSKFTYEEGLLNAYNWWKEQENTEPDFAVEDALIQFLKIKDDPEKSENDLVMAKEAIKEELAKLKKRRMNPFEV